MPSPRLRRDVAAGSEAEEIRRAFGHGRDVVTLAAAVLRASMVFGSAHSRTSLRSFGAIRGSG